MSVLTRGEVGPPEASTFLLFASEDQVVSYEPRTIVRGRASVPTISLSFQFPGCVCFADDCLSLSLSGFLSLSLKVVSAAFASTKLCLLLEPAAVGAVRLVS